jgi:hypothetical protein
MQQTSPPNSRQTSTIIGGLPTGNSTLYVCVKDALLAQTCEFVVVAVEAPRCDFKLSDALSGVNVDQMLGTGDPAVLTAGASGFKSLARYVPPPGCNGSHTNGSTAATTGDTQGSSADMNDTIRATAGAFVSSLASAAGSLMKDPQAVEQVGNKECCRKGYY